MSDLEHNIKKAFAAHDAKSALQNKGALWNRLDGAMHPRKSVAAYWRIAAILLEAFLLCGAFAALNIGAKKQLAIENLSLTNQKLETTIDSLQAMHLTQIQTKPEFVEKEKIVYRDKIIYKEAANDGDWETKYFALSDSVEKELEIKHNLQYEIQKLKNDLEQSKQELVAIKTQLDYEKSAEQAAPFELKSERIELEVQKKPEAKKPGMEMKILQKQFIENRNNLNKNLFNK